MTAKFQFARDIAIDRRDVGKLILGGGSLLLGTSLLSPARAQSPDVDPDDLHEPGKNPDRILGDPNAPVTIVEYASMTCPHCATFHNTVLPTLKANYIDTGKAKLIFREFPLDDLALIVSLLARCVEGDSYFVFLDVLFKQQRTWASDPKNVLMRLSKQVGITEEGFDKCIQNQEVLNGIGWERDRAKNEFDVSATPTVFVNGRKMQSGASAADISAVIDAML